MIRNPKKRLSEIEAEIEDYQSKLNKMKRNFPYSLIFGIAFPLIFPFVPGKRGREPLATRMEYWSAVMLSAIIFYILVPIFYFMAVGRLKNKIKSKSKELKLLRYRIENEPNTL